MLSAGGVARARCASPCAGRAEIAGSVSREAALQTSLEAGTPIYVGGADHVLSAYAAGLSATGDWLVKLGGAGDILVVSDCRRSTGGCTWTPIRSPGSGCPTAAWPRPAS